MLSESARSQALTLPMIKDDQPDLPVAPGDDVGNFRLVRLMARGGMGGVFEAIHHHIDRRVAIKVLYSASLATYPQIASRFLNEARVVNLARHPGLVDVYDYGALPCGLPYLIMEYLEGESLGDRLDRTWGTPLPEAPELARQIACALSAAHGKGIVHRDIKPENIFLCRKPDPPFRERVKVLDFGVAKVAGFTAHQTLSGVTLGTPEYMAPEQCLGLVSVTGKADVYALGVLLFEMLAGRHPFTAELALDYMVKHVREAPPLLSDLRPEVSPGLVVLVGAMLEKEPERRPHMNEVAAELARLLSIEAQAQRRPMALPRREAGAAPRHLVIMADDREVRAARVLSACASP